MNMDYHSELELLVVPELARRLSIFIFLLSSSVSRCDGHFRHGRRLLRSIGWSSDRSGNRHSWKGWSPIVTVVSRCSSHRVLSIISAVFTPPSVLFLLDFQLENSVVDLDFEIFRCNFYYFSFASNVGGIFEDVLFPYSYLLS